MVKLLMTMKKINKYFHSIFGKKQNDVPGAPESDEILSWLSMD